MPSTATITSPTLPPSDPPSTSASTSNMATVPSVTSASATVSGGSGSMGAMERPSAMKRHSSASSQPGVRQVTSPGSATEHHPLRHTVGGGRGTRHAKIVLPRNHSSGRNLAKMGRQAAAAQQQAVQFAADESKRHTRQRSHDKDTEIRLPGSLEEDRPPIRRNMTAFDLPRNKSGAKLKKNLSHGQLTRLSSGKNLATLGLVQRAPPSPGLKPTKQGKRSRPQSQEIQLPPKEKDLHEQGMALMQKQREQQERKVSADRGAPKKVGFAVGSLGDTEEDEDASPGMEETEAQQEDEWTEESASASPYSTRQNTANNSRRTSVAQDKPPDQSPVRRQPTSVSFGVPATRQSKKAELEESTIYQNVEADGTPAASEASTEDSRSPKSVPQVQHKQENMQKEEVTPPPIEKQAVSQPPQIRSPLHLAKDHPSYPNPTAKRLTSAQLPAPTLLSSISALDDTHSVHGSPAPSLRSARSTMGQDGTSDQDQDELVSRFMPSASHPSTGSGSNTHTMNTPKTGSFQGHTPEDESIARTRNRNTTFHAGPVSPGSTRSGSSGATTPAIGRSRIELKMMHDKAVADREAAAERQPLVPHHIYDRRNETLKSYLNLANLRGSDVHRGPPASASPYSMGPEIFQGRFKAVNTELKIVQKFRDPIAESLERLKRLKAAQKAAAARTAQAQAEAQAQQKGREAAMEGLKGSKSAVTLPSRARAGEGSSKLSASAEERKQQAKSLGPIRGSKGLGGTKSSTQLASAQQSPARKMGPQARRGVSFAGAEVEEPLMGSKRYDGIEEAEGKMGADGIARLLWNSVA
ncbi:hypothetical protein LTR62_003447 [Meristemomyces frigidus]|uniref:Uncharacterized protein n=1 Tax=Meristemomyces frigidus TaxID=1508187 RepID=A0AAN7YGV4_9PEZI|nr:hypothetical protein LTR62_003447 [Meristemomyces frigidus]